MDDLFAACARLFEKSPQPFGIAHVLLDDEGKPEDFTYAFLNPSMAAMTHQQVEDLLGVAVYKHWPGSDQTWVDYFYQAAYEDTAVEFEAVSAVLDQFLNVIAFPIKKGYCGFFVHDVTDWMARAQLTLQNAAAGIFFYDRRTHIVLLTQAAREQCNASRNYYLNISELLDEVFGSSSADILRDIEEFSRSEGRMLYEGKIESGRWLRLSLTHTGVNDRFAYGFLEDITRMKSAEREAERRNEIINCLSTENYALYLVDFENDHVDPYRTSDHQEDIFPRLDADGTRYSSFIERYIRTYVAAEDQEAVAESLDRHEVLRRLRTTGDFSLTYRRIFGTAPEFVELRIFLLTGSRSKAVYAARNINNEILDQLRQREILENALRLAEQASNAKSSFLTNMSHDLRTPMNSITGFAHLALDHIDDREKVQNALEKIILSSEHLIQLVNDILDFSRIENGKVEMSEDFIDLNAWGKSVGSIFVEQAERKSIAFTVDTSKILHPQVIGDRTRLNQVLVNTIGNALKFTDDGGRVKVTIDELASAPTGYGVYRFRVADTGCGMTPEFIDHIFEPFERDERARDSHIEGAGLGMTITKNIVDMLGGGIDVQSAVGEGSTFTIIIPLRRAQMDETAVSADTATPLDTRKRDFEGLKALVVDDDDLSREIVVELFNEHGIRTVEASDGDEAISVFEASAPGDFNVIIMDLRMPRLSGDEATRRIRALARPDAETIPIIATTADAFEEGFRRAREAGMTAHLTKPLNLRVLLDVLETYALPI